MPLSAPDRLILDAVRNLYPASVIKIRDWVRARIDEPIGASHLTRRLEVLMVRGFIEARPGLRYRQKKDKAAGRIPKWEKETHYFLTEHGQTALALPAPLMPAL